MEKDNEKQKTIKHQIEYYLSDENLKGDEFFHKLISEDKEGYLSLDMIMSCKKVKNAGWTKDEIIEAIASSEEVEVSPDKSKIRRKNNKALPSLDQEFLNKKRKMNANKEKKEPIILSIKSNKDTEISWKDIQEKYKKINPTLTVQYTRFKTNAGFFAVVPMGSNEQTEEGEISFEKEFVLNDVTFTVYITKGEELENFYKENGEHLDMCLNHEKKKKINKKNQTKLNTPLTLGDTLFVDICHIKGRVRKIISTNPDMNPLGEADFKFIRDLLNYHQDKDKLLEGLESIKAGKIDPHNYSKAFFACNDKGKNDLFLVNKCIEKIQNENKKKHNK